MFPSGVTILNTRVHVPFRGYNPKYKGSCSLLINI